MLTQERLRELLDYNAETGIFKWKESPSNGISSETEAGCVDVKGYVVIRVDNKKYYAHRLAILYVDGYMPENTVDHVNRVRADNRRTNLREASHQCQSRNCGVYKNNTSGVKGVSWRKVDKKWQAMIAVGVKRKHIGVFDTILEASYHRYAAEQCLGYPECDTNSSAKQFIETATT